MLTQTPTRTLWRRILHMSDGGTPAVVVLWRLSPRDPVQTSDPFKTRAEAEAFANAIAALEDAKCL